MRSLTLSLITSSILALSACGGEPDESTSLSSGTTGGMTGGAETTASTSPTSVSATDPGDTTTGGTTTGNTSGPTTGPTTGGSGTTTESSVTSEPGTTVEPGTADSSGGGTTGEGTTGEGTTGEGTTGGGTTGEGTTGGGTTGAVDCAGFGPMECMAQDACQAISGSKLNVQKMCVAKPTFFECSDAVVCTHVETYACDAMADPPEPFLFPSSCLPMGWEPCEAPPLNMPCK